MSSADEAMIDLHAPSAPVRAMLDTFQRNFPLTTRPFAVVGDAVGLTEEETLEALRALRAAGALSRIGAVTRPHAAGASTLAAVAAPAERIEEAARVIGRFEGVNHSYEREHAFNLWFVVTGLDRADVAATLSSIEAETGLVALDLPMERGFHLDLGFTLFSPSGDKPKPKPLRRSADARDVELLGAIETGLALTPHPYATAADAVAMTQEETIFRLQAMVADGVISRFGLVVRHAAFGYTANAMAVWDIVDERVDALGEIFAQQDGVTLCYRRPRRAGWRHNLFTMVHGRERSAALAVVARLAAIEPKSIRFNETLFSLRCFKQRGARFSSSGRSVAA
jgi:DNA-binding Lrp family transcriptional regulator